MFGSVTDEQLDLMTLEQVRMWTLAKRQSAGSSVEDKQNPERAQRMREASHSWSLPVMNLIESGAWIETRCGSVQAA